ncbi:MAG TPA: DUF429 domain-containing protein, partial [Anaerolineales bacterium]|nr:DUF429 domain-containing protein [Anaerolineales bacterium]
MFFEGAPRLLNAGVDIHPCRVRNDSRVVLETYPALVARRWIGQHSYKTDAVQQQTPAMRVARGEILCGLRSTEAKIHFGFDVHFSDEDANGFVQDGSGDQVDAFLCAIQAGWAYSKRAQNYGIPKNCD